MSNMAYCRFENTVGDLEDCYDHLNDEGLGEYEAKARTRLINLCIDIAKEQEDKTEVED